MKITLKTTEKKIEGIKALAAEKGLKIDALEVKELS